MTKLIAMLAAGLATAPAQAGLRDAVFASSADRTELRSGMFVGASYSVGFNRAVQAPQGKASLKMSGMVVAPGTSQIRFGDGIELALRGNAKPALLVGGSDVGQIRKSAKLSGTTTVMIVVGVAALAAGIYVAALHIEDDRKNVE